MNANINQFFNWYQVAYIDVQHSIKIDNFIHYAILKYYPLLRRSNNTMTLTGTTVEDYICPVCYKNYMETRNHCTFKMLQLDCLQCKKSMRCPKFRSYCKQCSNDLRSCYVCSEIIHDGNYYLDKFRTIFDNEVTTLTKALGILETKLNDPDFELRKEAEVKKLEERKECIRNTDHKAKLLKEINDAGGEDRVIKMAYYDLIKNETNEEIIEQYLSLAQLPWDTSREYLQRRKNELVGKINMKKMLLDEYVALWKDQPVSVMVEMDMSDHNKNFGSCYFTVSETD